MANVSKFKILGQTINVKDATARSNISTINNTISNIQTDLNKKALDLTELVWIGDSFSTGIQPDLSYLSDPIPKVVAAKLGLNLHNYGANAAGFCSVGEGGSTFLTQIQAAIADTSYNHDAVKYVVFLGGINDVNLGYTYDQINAASNNVFNTLKSDFTNAEILYFPNWGAVYVDKAGQYKFSGVNPTNNNERASRYFGSFLGNLVGAPALMASDNVHPNQLGAYKDADTIVSLINGEIPNSLIEVPIVAGSAKWDISHLKIWHDYENIIFEGYATVLDTITLSDLVIGYFNIGFNGNQYIPVVANTGGCTVTAEIVPISGIINDPPGHVSVYNLQGNSLSVGENVLFTNVRIPIL